MSVYMNAHMNVHVNSYENDHLVHLKVLKSLYECLCKNHHVNVFMNVHHHMNTHKCQFCQA